MSVNPHGNEDGGATRLRALGSHVDLGTEQSLWWKWPEFGKSRTEGGWGRTTRLVLRPPRPISLQASSAPTT